MASQRTCTKCSRSEPDIYFESSSGGYCYFCMTEVRLKEWQHEQEKREYFQWLQHTDHKPYVPEKVGKSDKRYRG